MASATNDYVRDEAARLSTLIETTVLWTQLRLSDQSRNAVATTADAPNAMRRAKYTQPLEQLPDVHRRFHVLPERVERTAGRAGAWSGGEQKVSVRFAITLGFQGGGGNAQGGDLFQLHAIAAQDAEAVRQKIEHPLNIAAGGTTGVTTGRTNRVVWLGHSFRYDPEHLRVFVNMTVVSDLVVDVEPN